MEHGAEKEALISCRGPKPTIHLYEKFGFHEAPHRKEFWKSEKVDIEMERRAAGFDTASSESASSQAEIAVLFAVRSMKATAIEADLPGLLAMTVARKKGRQWR